MADFVNSQPKTHLHTHRDSNLHKTIESLLVQSFSDFELIINDDCSTDETEIVCRHYQELDSRIRYFRNPVNLKMPGNLNTAIKRATGEYIANVHDGDVYRSDLIEKWKLALDEVPTASFVFNHYEAVSRDGKRTIFRQHDGRIMDGKSIALYYFNTFTSCVWGTVMAKRCAYEKQDFFNSRYGFISDVDMWLRLAYNSDVAYVPEILITLAPREENHLYDFLKWQQQFWTLEIYVNHLNIYKSLMPREVEFFRANYYKRRRNIFLRAMAICIKHQQWDRAKEGMAILRDSNDILLKKMGHLFSSRNNLPNWYNLGYWDRITI